MKQQLVTEEKIVDEVRKAVVEGLDIEANSVKPESSLIKDLGAESLDFLDINYRLEQTFGIKLARHSILEHIEEKFGEESAIDENGLLTEKAAKLLRLRFDYGGVPLEAGMDIDEIPSVVTVSSIVEGVKHVLDSLPGQCPACGKSAWELDGETRVKCSGCGAEAVFANGDDLIAAWLDQVQEKEKIF